MLESEICTIDEVAAVLGRAPGYISRNWRRLNRDANFPRPLPGSSYDRWSRAALTAWLRSNGLVAPEEEGDLVAAARAAIHAELGVPS